MSEGSQDTCSPHGHDFQALSEDQLRQLHDEEEVRRFLSFFSAYVTEVRLSPGVARTETGSTGSHIVDNPDATLGEPSTPHPADRSLSEHIAYSYLLPRLAPATSVASVFTLNRLNLAIQRLCLALLPPYRTFLLNLARLALWEDYQRSLRYCIMFWFLWFHDLLLPCLVFYIMYRLLRRRLSAYPTFKELRDRRQETARALQFWEAVQERLSVTTLDPTDLWRFFKLYKSKGKMKETDMPKDAIETDEEEDLRRDILRALHELADLHERVKNIFAWHRPEVSCRYLIFLIVVSLGTLVLPAQYVAKLVYWLGGVVFWHVTPVVAVIPRRDRIRLLSLFFGDAPTDADYAMELIAKHVVTGHHIDATSLESQSSHLPEASTSTDNLTPVSCGDSSEVRSSEDNESRWKKWAERVSRGKAFLEEGRQLLSSDTMGNTPSGEINTGRHSGAGGEHIFFAQYGSSPGLITLTSSTLFFTPLVGSRAVLVIPRDRLRSVRRSGLMKGISITWVSEELMDGEEREEKFQWVGNRNELFTRLAGSDGGRWITV